MAKNVEYLESFEVSICPPATSSPLDSLFRPYNLRLKFQGNPVVLDIELDNNQLKRLLLELAQVGRALDEQTHG